MHALETINYIFLFISISSALISADEMKPPFWQKAETARWLAHSNLWGVLSTTSVHLNGQAWGQPKSFSDGNSTFSSGKLYFYDSDMDTSMQVSSITFQIPGSVCLYNTSDTFQLFRISQ
jgi:hypothetical protein